MRGGAVTLVSQLLRLVAQTLAIAVLARLIDPDGFGVVAIVTTFAGFFLLFRDGGLMLATIQAEEISDARLSTLFWLNVLIGVVLTVVFCAIAPVLAFIYDDYRLLLLTVVYSVTLLIPALTIQHEAMLRRQLRLESLAIVDLAAAVIGYAVAILLAYRGGGYWALVIAAVITAVLGSLGRLVALPWRPGRPSRGTGVRELLRYGSHLTGFHLVNYAVRNGDNLLISLAWGPSPLAFYTRAYGIFLLPLQQLNTPLSAAAVPAMSRLRGEPEHYRAYFMGILRLLALATLPVSVMLFVLAPEVVLLLLGSDWAPTAVLLQILAPAAAFQPIGNAAGWQLSSTGRADQLLRWSFIAAPVVVAGFLIGLPWGAQGVAASYVISTALLFPLQLRHFCAGSPVSPFDVVRASAPGLIASLVLLGLLLPVVGAIRGANAWITLGVASALGLAVVGAVGAVLHLPRIRSAISRPPAPRS